MKYPNFSFNSMIAPAKRCLIFIAMMTTALTSDFTYADILFVDMNVSSLEVQAAREAAAVRHENLIVIPDISDANRTQIAAIQARIAPLEHLHATTIERLMALEAHGGRLSQIFSLRAQIDDIEARMEPDHDHIRELAGGTYNFPNLIDRSITGAEAAHQTITAVVVSAHSNGELFAGTLSQADMTSREFGAVFARHPTTRASIHGLYAWGCYTNTHEMAQQYHRDFSDTPVVLGFSTMAPSGVGPVSAALLRDALIREGNMALRRDLAQTNANFLTLNGVTRTSASATINGCFVGARVMPQMLDGTDPACRVAETRLGPQLENFRRFLEATPTPSVTTTPPGSAVPVIAARTRDYDDPPPNEHRSDLRNFYSFLQDHSHCPLIALHLPPRLQALSLIFFRNVRANFAAYYRDDIEQLNQILEAHHAPPEARIPALTATGPTRREILALIQSLRTYENTSPALDANEGQRLHHVTAQLTTLLRDLVCVPMTWITRVPSRSRPPEAPACH